MQRPVVKSGRFGFDRVSTARKGERAVYLVVLLGADLFPRGSVRVCFCLGSTGYGAGVFTYLWLCDVAGSHF